MSRNNPNTERPIIQASGYMVANQQEFVLIVEKKNQSVNLVLEKWDLDR